MGRTLPCVGSCRCLMFFTTHCSVRDHDDDIDDYPHASTASTLRSESTLLSMQRRQQQLQQQKLQQQVGDNMIQRSHSTLDDFGMYNNPPRRGSQMNRASSSYQENEQNGRAKDCTHLSGSGVRTLLSLSTSTTKSVCSKEPRPFCSDVDLRSLARWTPRCRRRRPSTSSPRSRRSWTSPRPHSLPGGEGGVAKALAGGLSGTTSTTVSKGDGATRAASAPPVARGGEARGTSSPGRPLRWA